MPPYQKNFSPSSRVRIVDRAALEDFRANWKYHHPLAPGQLQYADALAVVQDVSYYHGGDVLYQLVDVPGHWHECCLGAADA